MVKAKKPRYYPAIPNSTIIDGIGQQRWKTIISAVKKKHGTTSVLFDYTKEGPKMHINDPFGKCLGTLAEVEEWANKQRKKR